MKKGNEDKIRKLIFEWTKHFCWRDNFSRWRESRIWQERFRDKEVRILEKIIPNLEEFDILDLGCGMGGFLVAMRRKGYNIKGLEPNPDYCEISKLRGKRYGLDLEIFNSKGEEMPFGKASFDLIYCNDVLEHCKNPRKILEESYRVLRKKGKVYLTVINRFAPKDPHYHSWFINWIPRNWADGFLEWRNMTKEAYEGKDKQKLSEMNYFTFWEFKKLAKEVGFKITDLKKEKLLRPDLIVSSQHRRIAKILQRFRVRRLFYSFCAPIFLNGFEFILEKRAP